MGERPIDGWQPPMVRTRDGSTPVSLRSLEAHFPAAYAAPTACRVVPALTHAQTYLRPPISRIHLLVATVSNAASPSYN